MRTRVAILFCIIACGAVCAEEKGAAAFVPRLVEQLDAALKNGENPRAWVEVFGKKQAAPVAAVSAQVLTVLVEGNDFPIKWEKLPAEDVFGIAVSIANEKPERLLLAGELAIAVGKFDKAQGLLAQAQLKDPALSAKAKELLAALPAGAPPPPKPVSSEHSAEPAPTGSLAPTPSGPAAKAVADPKLQLGWWKGYQAPAVDVGKVYAGRPRIYLRDKAWGEGGLTLDVLRARGAQDPWKGWVPRFTEDVCNLAMKYLLSGDKAAADKAVGILLTKMKYAADTDDGDEMERRCMAYDWLWNYPGFDAEKKKQAAALIAADADEMIKRLQTGGPHIFHTRMHAWANGVVFAGLALAGDHPKAGEYLSFGYKYWREKLFPARWFLGGALQNGFGYGRKFLFRSTCAFLNAWHSGTGEDLWKLVRDEQDDWIGEHLRFLIYTHYPDGTYPRYGDCYNFDDEKFSGGLAMMCAAGSHDPYAAGLADALFKKHGLRTVEDHWNIYPLLFWDPNQPKRAPDDLPLTHVFGQHGLGCVSMLGGWGPKDAHIFYKCGDIIENHGHFDQGSFEIFREHALTFTSGTYADGMGSPHYKQYFCQSVASNTLLISDPANTGDHGWQREVYWQNADSMDTYLNHKENEAGDILEVRTAPDHSVVVSDLSAAYDSAKVTQVTRVLVFVKGTYLVVFDTVQTTKPGLRPLFLLHYPTDAVLDKTRATIDNGSSRLTCETLLPENPKLTKIAGFLVDGKDCGPKAKIDAQVAGAGRVEIEPPDVGRTSFQFLNVLTIGPKEFSGERPHLKVNGEVTLELAGKTLVFQNSGKSVQVK